MALHRRHGRLIPSAILAGSLVLFSALLWRVRAAGIIDIDDAYITFRYAENVASGLGFVYNPGERVPGTTTPLFCLMLAAMKIMRVSVPLAADLINLAGAGLAAMIIFLIARETKGKALGLMTAFLFVFFPHFWLNLVTGMETMFTLFLCLLVVWLDLIKRPVWLGLAAAALLLTRVDALALVAAVVLVGLFRHPRHTLTAAAVMVLALIPWAAFSWSYFGAIIPHTIPAKRLIHVLPGRLVVENFRDWFFGLEEKSGSLRVVYPVMTAYAFFALLGSVRALFKERWAIVFILWIGFYIAGLSLANASPFFWYKIPMLAGYLVLAALGADWFCRWLGRGRTVSALLKLAVPVALVILLFSQYSFEKFKSMTAKEQANLELARTVRKISTPAAKVFAGEIGIAGYELLDYYIIDSAGLVSEQVYKIRLADREKLLKISPAYKWDWWGSEDWVKEVIVRFRPEFILSDVRYLHLKQLLVEPGFKAEYQIISARSTDQETIILLKRKPI